MPYGTLSGRLQRSRSIGHVPIVENESIRRRLREYRVFTAEPGMELDTALFVAPEQLKPAWEEPLRWAIAFDGSPSEVPVRETYPSTRIGYIQVGGVLVNLQEMLSQDKEHLVDPVVVRDSVLESLYSVVLPGSNVCREDMSTVRDSWRAEVYGIFSECKVEDITLLEIYQLLMSRAERVSEKGDIVLSKCSASPDCDAMNIAVATTGSPCPQCNGALFPTDALRLYEDVSEHESNALALTRLMQVLEQLTMIGYLEWLSRRRPAVLGKMAFMFDGPLAVFGSQASLHRAILGYLHYLESYLGGQGLYPPIIVGIEKSGQFVEHARAIADSIPSGRLMLLPDKYIYSRILTFRQDTTKPYGEDTYYGQKFIYKTNRDQLFVITIPKRSVRLDNPWEPEHYPRLAETLLLLEKVGTTLYENALIPVALAHDFVSIPLRTGSRVLHLLSQTHLGANTTE